MAGANKKLRFACPTKAELAERREKMKSFRGKRADAEAGSLAIGDVMKDGTIFAGISPDTSRPMYAAPADARVSMNFNAAAHYAERLEVGGRKGFRVPSKAELKFLFDNREKGALKEIFNPAGSEAAGWYKWYWSSTDASTDSSCDDGVAYAQRCSDGCQFRCYKRADASVRCVR